MSSDHIRKCYNECEEHLGAHPEDAKGSGACLATVTDGLTVEIAEGDYRYTVDMPKGIGGKAAGPTPGFLGRGALASCLAMGYMMRAAKYGVPIDALTVRVEADFDDRGLFGIGEIPAGYTEVRYVVHVTSNAPEEDIQKVLDETDAHSPYLDVFSRAQKCVRKLELERSPS
jgi:uncharacterized OsmC-like protein